MAGAAAAASAAGTPAARSRSVACSFCCAAWSSLDELGVQVAPAVDVADEVGLGLRGAGGGGLRFLRGGAERGELRAARLERLALAFELGERLGVRLDAIAIELGQRRDRPGRLAQTAKVGRREQQPQISRLAELVDFDETLLQLGELGPAPRPGARPSATLVLSSSTCTLRGIRVHALELFRLDLPLHLELAQVAEQRALVGRQSIRFALERLQPLGGAPRQRLGPCALGQGLRETAKKPRRPQRSQRQTQRTRILCVLRAPSPQPPVPSPLENGLAIYI